MTTVSDPLTYIVSDTSSPYESLIIGAFRSELDAIRYAEEQADKAAACCLDCQGQGRRTFEVQGWNGGERVGEPLEIY